MVVVENEGVVFVTGFSKESWFDLSRSLSKFLQLASNRVFFGELKFPSSDQPLVENNVRAVNSRARLAVAGRFLSSLEKKAMAGNQFGEHHGQKRHADDELESNHNISTQFKKLRISIRPFQTSHEAADQGFRSFLPPRTRKWG